MNIFCLDNDPVECAKMHNDKHTVKMCVEYAQLMSTAHRVVDGNLWYGRTINGRKIARYFHANDEMNSILYKACHINHPSAIWTRKCEANYNWLYNLWTALCEEYSHRYQRMHESFNRLEIPLMLAPEKIPSGEWTQPTPAMSQYKQCIVEGDSIQSYRNYYWEAKADMAKWTKRNKPVWWTELENVNGG